MINVYDWRIKRSGNAMTVFGKMVRSCETAIRMDKLVEIGTIQPEHGEIYAYDKSGNRIARLSMYSNPR